MNNKQLKKELKNFERDLNTLQIIILILAPFICGWCGGVLCLLLIGRPIFMFYFVLSILIILTSFMFLAMGENYDE